MVGLTDIRRVKRLLGRTVLWSCHFLGWLLRNPLGFFCVNKFGDFCTMDSRIQHIKGIHLGVFLERELKLKGVSKGPFALSIGEYPQTLSAIIHGKRKMNTSLALRIEEALGLEKGTLMLIQVYHDIKQEEDKKNGKIKPDLNKLRESLFGDTDINKIDWIKRKVYVIERVMERGTEEEKQMINNFYRVGFPHPAEE